METVETSSTAFPCTEEDFYAKSDLDRFAFKK